MTQPLIMSPKEKAEELVERFMDFPLQKITDYSRVYYPTAKYFALVCADEVINSKPIYNSIEYWEQVKQEIEKL